MSRTKIQAFAFLATIVLVTVAFLWLLSPYYGAILWAVILAILFEPLQRGLENRLDSRRNLAAALSVLACICVVVIPGTLILAALANEAAGLYTRISTREFDPGTMLAQLQGALPSFVWKVLAALDLGDMAQLQSRLTSFLLEFSKTVANRAIIIGQNTAQFVISLGVMLYLLFFLFRDGVALAARIRKASPLGERETDQLLDKFTSVMKATVKGNVTIAAIQGVIGGVTFWMLGIQAALLWGVLMAVLSLLPAVGAGLVWVPAAAYLLLTGAYLKGAILLAIGTLVISTVDNLLRPPLVGKGTMLPDYAVLISTVGGLSLIGMNGFVLGPLIVALFVAAWSLFSDDKMQP
jgi:predicted PurR-regulated permease PerM